MSPICGNDATLNVGSQCRDLDFTLEFEEVVLSIILDSIFIGLACRKVYLLRWESIKVSKTWTSLFMLKSILALLVLGCAVALLAAHSTAGMAYMTKTTTPSLAVALISAILLLPTLTLEHTRLIIPSSLIAFYCLIKPLFLATRLRTYILISIAPSSPAFITTVMAIAFYSLLLLAEMAHKSSILLPSYADYATEAKGSFLTRSMYLWLLPVMWKGRTSRFQLKDLDRIPSDFKAVESRAPLLAALQHGKYVGSVSAAFSLVLTTLVSSTRSSSYLLLATLRSFGGSFFSPVIPRLVLLLATFAQPLLLKDTLDFMSSSDAPDARGWAIFGGFICVYGSMVLSNALYWEKLYAVTVKYRGALVGAIYMKTLRLASHVSRPLGMGVGSNYMSVDVERIGLGIEEFHELWAAVLSLPLAFALLYSEANWAAFLPIGVMLFALGATSALAKQAGDKQTQWSAKTDERIKFMSSAINQLLPIKLFAYESYIAKKAEKLRKIELRALKKFYMVIMFTATISNSLMTCTLFVVIGVYAAVWGRNGANGLLDASKIFTIYSIVQLLSRPFNVLGQTLPSLLAAYASMKRLEKFFLFDEKTTIDEKQAFKTVEKSKNANQFDVTLRGSFSWNKGAEPVLNDIDVQIPTGKLTICAGPVAAGKTSFMLALMGELYPTSELPKRHVPSIERIGYTGQEAFIMPGTLRENILFGREYEETFYNSVIEACSLKVDFSRMVSGDETRVTGAKTLSGGQKQRIALARAVYSQAPLLLLDDPFSALDGETTAHVFHHLLGPQGLLKGQTVLLVTHYVHHLPSADYVLILQKGKVIHRGTWSDVQEAGYKLSELARTGEASREYESTESSQEEDLEPKNVGTTEMIGDEYDAVDAVDEESNKPYLGGLKPYVFWFGNAGIIYSITAMASLLLVAMIALANQGYLKEWSESDGSHYTQWIAGLSAFSAAYFIVILLGLYFFSLMMVPRIGQSVHTNELRGLFHSTISWIQTTPSGKIINRFSQDLFEIDATFASAFLNGGIAGWGLMGSLIIIYASSPWLTISAPPMLVSYWLLFKFYLASSKQLQQLEVASKSPLYTVFGTTLSGLEVIRAYRADKFFLGQNDKHLDASQGPFHFRFATIRFLKTTLSLMTFIVAVGLTGTVIGLRRSTSVALLGMALSQLTSLTNQLSQLLTNFAVMENGTISIARLQEIAELPSENDGEILSVVPKKAETWPSQGSVVFDNVKLQYGEKLPEVLKGISFSIKPGMKVGICGRTGSGKSSAVQALFRAVDSSLIQGKITIDGVDITTLPLRTLRNCISIVTQEPFLWYDTIRNNLDVEGNKTDDQIWVALEQVGLKRTFEGYPSKLETIIEDSGSFSRGERQLLCMARVLLRSRRIVVLDEATSSMDLETDDLVRRVVNTEMKDCTVMAVAHRIATIVEFDLIMVLEDGLIVECGSPRQLLAQQGRFSQLAASQGIHLKSLLEEITE